MSSKLSQLCDKYQAIVFFDAETTGLDPSVDQIIELAAVRITRNQAGFLVLDEKMDAFVKLLEGQKLPDKIVELTHITDEMIQKDGVDATAAASAFNNLIRGRTLLVAHNAQFDLLFSRALLHYTDIGTARLGACDYIDSLTVYKDRAAYPHKLANAIEHYSLEEKSKTPTEPLMMCWRSTASPMRWRRSGWTWSSMSIYSATTTATASWNRSSKR